ncbi:MAG TPA: GtrA family protein [Hyphomicrobium sp.]|nr:GtrA family protein [Hyphomicrobium sp.]
MTEPAPYSGVRHGAGFLASGILATGTDASVLLALTRGYGLGPFSARLIAIACAMVVGYFAHRRLTFRSREPASLAQFAKFVSVAASASATNFFLYGAILLMWPATEPLMAMIVPTIAGMVVSYLGLRSAVFRKSRGTPPPV